MRDRTPGTQAFHPRPRPLLAKLGNAVSCGWEYFTKGPGQTEQNLCKIEGKAAPGLGNAGVVLHRPLAMEQQLQVLPALLTRMSPCWEGAWGSLKSERVTVGRGESRLSVPLSLRRRCWPSTSHELC